MLGSLSLAIDLHQKTFSTKEEITEFIRSSLSYLETARPTGVNMTDCAKRLNALLDTLLEDSASTVESITERCVTLWHYNTKLK